MSNHYPLRKQVRITGVKLWVEMQDTDGREYKIPLTGDCETLYFIRGLHPPTAEDLEFTDVIGRVLDMVGQIGKLLTVHVYGDNAWDVRGYRCPGDYMASSKEAIEAERAFQAAFRALKGIGSQDREGTQSGAY